MPAQTDRSNLLIALAGLVALAVAMGIGRFAFTPLLPLMQGDAGLTLAEGGWLASANYFGYLVGALMAARPRLGPALLLRAGLVLVVVTTALMAFGNSLALWALVRFIAGVASAWVLVGTAAASLAHLAAAGAVRLPGVVFAGVGLGIVLAGLLCQAIAVAGWSSRAGWALLALVGAAGTLWVVVALRRAALAQTPSGRGGQRVVASSSPDARPDRAESDAVRRDDASTGVATEAPVPKVEGRAARREGWRLVACYGLFGFGYIVPATFLPAQARALIPDPVVFGWVWPVFGLAAIASTLIAARWAAAWPRRRLWAASHLVMAVGVALPAVSASLAALVASALCVGGTFMVVTMVGLQEARHVAQAAAQRLMAAMTAAFATGQLVGPLVVGAASAAGWPIDAVLALAALGLVASAALLVQAPDRREPDQSGHGPTRRGLSTHPGTGELP